VKVDSAAFFYLRMPRIRDIGDGSQDACLVRLRAGRHEGWGQCEASPLPTIAAWDCPMSHSACHPVRDSVLGKRVDSPADIRAINESVRALSLDLLQAAHTLSGVDIALWDLLGKKMGEPVWSLLGYRKAYPKLPYASVLFGNTPRRTYERALLIRGAGFRAAKFGWGPYGRGTVREDAAQVHAAREGLGREASLLIDAGTVWVDDVAAAAGRLKALKECRARWLEEPFVSGALGSYSKLARMSGRVGLAGGEGAHDYHMAANLIEYGKVGFIQVDTGRIGGITTAKQVADLAEKKGVKYVNHTFTSHLSLCASLQPYAGLRDHELCEYPVESSVMSSALTRTRLEPGPDGFVRVPGRPGLGIAPDPAVIRRYRVPVLIRCRIRGRGSRKRQKET